jgi:hypothetical protein
MCTPQHGCHHRGALGVAHLTYWMPLFAPWHLAQPQEPLTSPSTLLFLACADNKNTWLHLPTRPLALAGGQPQPASLLSHNHLPLCYLVSCHHNPTRMGQAPVLLGCTSSWSCVEHAPVSWGLVTMDRVIAQTAHALRVSQGITAGLHSAQHPGLGPPVDSS